MRYYKARYGVLNAIVKAESQSDALMIAMEKFNFKEGAVIILPATDKEIRRHKSKKIGNVS